MGGWICGWLDGCWGSHSVLNSAGVSLEESIPPLLFYEEKEDNP